MIIIFCDEKRILNNLLYKQIEHDLEINKWGTVKS